MDRKEYLKEFFVQVEERFAVDLRFNKNGVKFAFNCLREKLSIEEAVEKLKNTYKLIEA